MPSLSGVWPERGRTADGDRPGFSLARISGIPPANARARPLDAEGSQTPARGRPGGRRIRGRGWPVPALLEAGQDARHALLPPPSWMGSKEEMAHFHALLAALDGDDTPRWPGSSIGREEFEYHHLRDQMDLRQARRAWR